MTVLQGLRNEMVNVSYPAAFAPRSNELYTPYFPKLGEVTGLSSPGLCPGVEDGESRDLLPLPHITIISESRDFPSHGQ